VPDIPQVEPRTPRSIQGPEQRVRSRAPLPARASLWPFLARSCGGPLTPTCPACGTRNEPGEKSCGDCGASLAQGNVEGAGPHRDPRAYTPKHLAGRILTTRGALEGERKQVTVLLADVKGSMELAEQIDPEEWHAILDRVFQILSRSSRSRLIVQVCESHGPEVQMARAAQSAPHLL
jgi:hypothetical protein